MPANLALSAARQRRGLNKKVLFTQAFQSHLAFLTLPCKVCPVLVQGGKSHAQHPSLVGAEHKPHSNPQHVVRKPKKIVLLSKIDMKSHIHQACQKCEITTISCSICLQKLRLQKRPFSGTDGPDQTSSKKSPRDHLASPDALKA